MSRPAATPPHRPDPTALAPLASGRSSEQLDADLKLYLATKLYEIGQVTLGQAAIAGLSKIGFVEVLGVMKVPVIRWDVAEAEQEFADG